MGNQYDNNKNKLLLIESEISSDPEFAARLAQETGLDVHEHQAFRDFDASLQPTIVIADLKTIGGAPAIERLYKRFGVPIIILSDRPSMAAAVQAMRHGACDFFPKPASVSAINDRIQGLIKKITAFSVSTRNHEQPNAIMPFWEQEREIIEAALNAFGGNISRAALALQISPSTIYRKKQSWNEFAGN